MKQTRLRLSQINVSALSVLSLAMASLVGLTGCHREPPSQRPSVTLPAYTQGNVDNGKTQYNEQCEKCHKLQAGNNEKGPQLMRIYGAKAALLTDYQYTDAMKNSNMMWTAENIDKYIANPKQTVVGTRMRSKPVSDAQTRQDIIAYLSTLR